MYMFVCSLVFWPAFFSRVSSHFFSASEAAPAPASADAKMEISREQMKQLEQLEVTQLNQTASLVV